MTDHPSSYADDLPMAEHQVRHYAYIEDTDTRWVRGEGPTNVVMANYTRLQAVERAAAELVHHWSWEGLAHDMSKPERRAWIAERDRLEDRLRALLTAAGPHQTAPENSNGELT